MSDFIRPKQPALYLVPTITTVHISDADYRDIRREIDSRTENNREKYFEIDYPVDVYSLNICGNIERDYSDSFGDGIVTPKDSIETVKIYVEFYECRDEDGLLVDTDFDHRSL